jgi:ketosteroid isomerase-like protein
MLVSLLLAVSTAAPECNHIPIGRMIDQYAALIKNQDSASIAHLFGESGMVDNPGAAPIRGEAAIGAFLSSFKGAVVKSESMTIADVARANEDWRVTGRFHQTGTTPQGKDYDAAGSFDSTWTCTAGGWRLKRMATGK